ncbi:PREDICTED: uncharacterized protein LOC107357497 [Acropora digitifera]|uniref:uncharacterized protein LOC107357497 n=1 Tax=Acropora digitifera TaxID=70779 RepID=UPI00077A9688|nr:PREDICTED: uncharacterized protein LOC107357497 [Acropora digitifera]XP_015779623.1 PREDICTED: uncharacterized protein LOC107357497 [Acropora digitifera]
MASQLDESVSSSRDSVIYDDITLGSNSGEDAPEKNGDSKKYHITSATKNGLESEESLKQCAKRNLCQRSDDAEISVEEDDQGKKMKEGNGPFIEEAVHNLHQEYKDDKELLTPVKTDEDSKLSHAVRDSKDLLYSQPIKPPRRHSQNKTNLKEKSKTENGESDLENLMESDTVTTKRSCLAPKPKPWAISEIKTDAGPMENEPLPLRDHREKPTEIVCKPVWTSSPNQDETPSLSVEAVDTLDTSRRVLSYLEASPEGGKGARKRVESFYDFLYSKEGVNSVVNVTLPSVQDTGRVGSQPTFSEEHAYDEVPLENSISESFGKKSILGSTYEEVIVNQEAYFMPSQDEESDEFSENDPWGSDFETEDEFTDAGSLKVKGDDEEEDPYDSVEISPMMERKRPFKFVSEITHFSPFKKTSASLNIPGLKVI